MSRLREGGATSLLVEATGSPGKVADEVTIGLPADLAGKAAPAQLPAGWSVSRERTSLKLSGPPAALPLRLRLDSFGVDVPARVSVRVKSLGASLLEREVNVIHGPPVKLAASLDGLLALPKALFAGDRITCQPLNPARTPAGGRWILAGVPMDEIAMTGSGVSLQVRIPGTLRAGDPIPVQYIDPWGERLVDAPSASLCRGSLPPSRGDRPRLEACAPLALTGQTACVCGWFPTPASSEGLTLNGKPLGPPVSASSGVVFVKIPADAVPGPARIGGAESAGFSPEERAAVTVVRVGGEIDRTKLMRGESTPMRLWVEGTAQPLALHVRNDTPEIIRLEGGNEQMIATDGKKPNGLTRTVYAVHVGDFTITYSLATDQCPCGGDTVTREPTPIVYLTYPPDLRTREKSPSPSPIVTPTITATPRPPTDTTRDRSRTPAVTPDIITRERSYTPTPTPPPPPPSSTPTPTYTPTPNVECKVSYTIEGGPGISIDAVGPAPPKSSKKNESIPLYVSASDMDQLLQTCACTVNGQPGNSTHKYINVPDTLQYRWRKVSGNGNLAGTQGPATLYQPPPLQVDESDSVSIEVQIVDLRDNDKPASVQFTITVKRTEECKYERTVAFTKKSDPGRKKEITDIHQAVECSPVDESWVKDPVPLQGQVPGKVKVCVGERALLTASASDQDTLKLQCAGSCGSDKSEPQLDDPVQYTWEADKGDFPDYGGHATSDSDSTSVIYKAPPKPGADVVHVHIRDSGKEAADPKVDKVIQVTAYKLDMVVSGHKDERAPDCEAYYICLNDDDDDKKGVDDRDVQAAAEDDLVQVTLKMEPEKSGNVTLLASSGAGKIRVWKDSAKSQELKLPYSPPKLPIDVWVEGFRPSDKARDVELVLKSDDPHCEVHRLFTVERPELDMDGVPHAARQNPGGFVCVNKDDDDNNQVPDKDDAIATAGVEDDLVPISIGKLPKEGSVTFRVTAGGNSVRVWEESADHKNLKGGRAEGKSYKAEDLPKKLWLEGVQASGGLADVRMEVQDDDSGCTSVLLVTVVDVDIRASMRNRDGGLVLVPEADEEKKGAFVAVNTDDDNTDGVLDKEQQPVQGENDLLKIDLDVNPRASVTGKLTLTATGAANEFHLWRDPNKVASEDLGKAITFDAAELPKTYWLEGVSPSSQRRDLALKLRCDQPRPCDDTVKVTAVQLHLQTDLDMDQKIDDKDWKLERKPGAYVVLNNDDDDRNGKADYSDDVVDAKAAPGYAPPAGARAEQDLKKFQITGPMPASLVNTGKVILRRSNGNVRVYSVPEKGVAARILWSAPPGAAGAGGYAAGTERNGIKTWDLSDETQRADFLSVRDHLWVEGTAPSGAERDTTLSLSYGPQDAGVEIEMNRVDLTVIRFEKIEATIDPTPPHTARALAPPLAAAGAAASNAPLNHVYSSSSGGIVHTLNADDANLDGTFAQPHALVLIRRGDDEVDFAATRQPALPMKWTVERASDDAAALGRGVPPITKTAGLTMSLSTDERGSFLVSVYYDANGNGKFDTGEPRAIVPLILVDTVFREDQSAAHTHVTATRVGTAATWSRTPRAVAPGAAAPPFRGISVSSGVYNPALPNPGGGGFDINNPNNAAMYFGATVDFIGGGPAGQRGLDRAFGGWVNNEIVDEDVTGTYQNGHRVLSVFASNAGPFLPGGGAPVILPPPFLDSGFDDGGQGGGSVTLTRSRMGATTVQPLGRRVLVESVDSPGQPYAGDHPGFPGSRLTGMTFNMGFHAWLAVWTNVTASDGRTNDAAERTYSSVCDFSWTLRGEWSVDAQGLSTRVGAPEARKGATTSYPARRARDETVEVRYPRGTYLLDSDARN